MTHGDNHSLSHSLSSSHSTALTHKTLFCSGFYALSASSLLLYVQAFMELITNGGKIHLLSLTLSSLSLSVHGSLTPLETIRALSLPRALTLSASHVSFLTLSSLSVQNLLLLSLCVDDPDWRSVSKQKQSKGTPADFHDLWTMSLHILLYKRKRFCHLQQHGCSQTILGQLKQVRQRKTHTAWDDL